MEMNSSLPIFQSRRSKNTYIRSTPLEQEQPNSNTPDTGCAERISSNTRGSVTEVIAKLALLSELEYEQRREPEAKALGMRVSVLDMYVKTNRQDVTSNKEKQPFEDVDAWPCPVFGADLLRELSKTVRRFCVTPEHSDVLMAAWVLHAWAHDAADISPLLAFVSQKRGWLYVRADGKFMMATWALPKNSPAFGIVFGAIKDHADFSTVPPQPDLFTFARNDEAALMMSAADLNMLAHDSVSGLGVNQTGGTVRYFSESNRRCCDAH